MTFHGVGMVFFSGTPHCMNNFVVLVSCWLSFECLSTSVSADVISKLINLFSGRRYLPMLSSLMTNKAKLKINIFLSVILDVISPYLLHWLVFFLGHTT